MCVLLEETIRASQGSNPKISLLARHRRAKSLPSDFLSELLFGKTNATRTDKNINFSLFNIDLFVVVSV